MARDMRVSTRVDPPSDRSCQPDSEVPKRSRPPSRAGREAKRFVHIIILGSEMVLFQVTPRLALAPWLVLGLSLTGCGGASDNLARKSVSGTVTLDGAPLKAGSIA